MRCWLVASASVKTDEHETSNRIDSMLKRSSDYLDPNPGRSAGFSLDALKLSRVTGDRNRAGQACLLLAKAYLKQKKTGDALTLINEAQVNFSAAGSGEGTIKAMITLGQACAQANDQQGAVRAFRMAMDSCRKYLKSGRQSEAFQELTIKLIATSLQSNQGGMGSTETIRVLHSYLTEFEKTRPKIGSYIALFISNQYRFAGKYDLAMTFAQRSLKDARMANDTEATIKIYGHLANIAYFAGKFSEALSYNLKALDISQANNKLKELANIYNNLGSIYENTGNLAFASDYFLKSLKMNEQANDSDGIVLTLGNLGLVYKTWGDFEKSRRYYLEAISLNERRENKAGKAINLYNLGNLYLMEHRGDSALYYLNQSLILKTELKDDYGMLISLDGLGRTYADELNRPLMALEYYKKAKAIASCIQSDNWLAIVNVDMAKALMKLNNAGKAGELFHQGLVYARKEQVYSIIQEALVSLVEISISRNAPAVINYFKELNAANDSVIAQEKARITMEMMVKFETEKIEKENQVLRKTGELQQLHLKNKNQTILLLSLILFLMLISGLIIAALYRQKDKAYRAIVLQHMNLSGRSAEPGQIPEMHKDGKEAKYLQDIKEEDHVLLIKLLDYFENEKPYLDPECNLKDLCKILNTNRTYLSTLINQRFNKNFARFINEYRVYHVKELLCDNSTPNYAIDEIGKLAGFGNRSSFHHHFRSIIGVTPAYFKKTAEKINMAGRQD